jgi:hypothetical protein
MPKLSRAALERVAGTHQRRRRIQKASLVQLKPARLPGLEQPRALPKEAMAHWSERLKQGARGKATGPQGPPQSRTPGGGGAPCVGSQVPRRCRLLRCSKQATRAAASGQRRPPQRQDCRPERACAPRARAPDVAASPGRTRCCPKRSSPDTASAGHSGHRPAHHRPSSLAAGDLLAANLCAGQVRCGSVRTWACWTPPW